MRTMGMTLKASAVVIGVVLAACGGGTGDGSEIAMGGGGSGGSGGHAGSLVIGDLAGRGGGGAGGMSSAGAGGSLAGSGSGGSAGSNAAGTSQGGSTSEPCTPASPQVPLKGSCLYADACTDEYDVTFDAATLQQLCEGQEGTWSTAPCVATGWDMKCTQEVFGGVYVQYLKADGFCFDGCEEPL